jgi:hypothetical protein
MQYHTLLIEEGEGVCKPTAPIYLAISEESTNFLFFLLAMLKKLSAVIFNRFRAGLMVSN